MMSEISGKIKAILNWSQGFLQQEETKSDSNISDFIKLCEKEYKFCKIPTQSMVKINEIEDTIQEMAKIIIDYKQV